MLLYGDRHVSYHYPKETYFFLVWPETHIVSLVWQDRNRSVLEYRQFMGAEVNKQEVPRRVTSPRLSIDKHAETATILLLTEFNNKLDLTSEKKRVKII